jgi:O-antigen ligase
MEQMAARTRHPVTLVDPVGMPSHVLVLLAALSAGIVAQGGYYLPGRILVTALVAVAVPVALRAHPWTRTDLGPVPVAAAALALWVLVRAGAAGRYPEALAAVGTLGCLVAVLLVLRRTGPAARESAAATVVAVGGLVAGSAWAGVAWRIPRFAVLVDDQLWRGASTLTYPNAAAALLVPLALLAIALLVARPRSVPRALAAYLLLVGAGTTLSRAGLLALLAGFVVLAVLAGIPAVLRHAVPVGVAAAVAVAALVPSFPATAAPHPVLAVLGLLAGAGLATGAVLLPGRIRAVATAAVLVAGAALAATQLRSGLVHEVWRSRGNLDSGGRTGALHVALELVARRPVTGTGVGAARFLWATPDGRGAVALYVHDEYLQTLVDLGAVGLVLLLGLAVAIVAYLYRARRYPHPPALRAGALAALAAFAVHSGFDFLWHIAVLPLAAGLFIGLAGPAIREEVVND